MIGIGGFMNINVANHMFRSFGGYSVHATTDKHFIIPKEQFREGVLIKNDKIFLSTRGKKLLSQIQIPLEAIRSIGVIRTILVSTIGFLEPLALIALEN